MKNILFTLALIVSFSSFGQITEELVQTIDELYDKGRNKMGNSDYYGALSDYTRVIEINPNDAVAYVNRGYCKMDLNDNVSACQDFRKAQEYGYDASDLITKTCY